MYRALLLCVLAWGAQAYPHYVPSCGTCGTAEAAAAEAAKAHRSLTEQAAAAARVAAGDAKTLGLSEDYQAQYGGKAAFKVFQEAGKSLEASSIGAGQQAANIAKAAGLSPEQQLKNAAITVAIANGALDHSDQKRADMAYATARSIAPSIDFASPAEQDEALKNMDGPIQFITGVLPTGHWNPGRPGGGPFSPVFKDEAAPVGQTSASWASLGHTEGHHLAGWEWFLMVFGLVVFLGGLSVLLYNYAFGPKSYGYSSEDDAMDEDPE
ncbi:Hyalin [Symbiodinium natans]|uniref:Hyalin protein n=1 Tax=Symbiodinium natans TaxID=878477 RepID=A0A812NY62_9DINO|nr:Hyalin [Symbiodinium natans]